MPERLFHNAALLGDRLREPTAAARRLRETPFETNTLNRSMGELNGLMGFFLCGIYSFVVTVVAQSCLISDRSSTARTVRCRVRGNESRVVR